MEIEKFELKRFDRNAFKSFLETNFANEPKKQEELLDIFDDFSKVSLFSARSLSEKQILEIVSNRREWLKANGNVSVITEGDISKLDSLDSFQKSASLIGDPFSKDTKVIVLESGVYDSGRHQDLVQGRAEDTFGKSWIFYTDSVNDNQKVTEQIYAPAVERLEKIIKKRESLGLEPIPINISINTGSLLKEFKDIKEFNQYYGTSLTSFEEPVSQVDRDKIMQKIKDEDPESAAFVESTLRLADRDGVKFINKSNGNNPKKVSLFSLLIKDHKKINTVGALNNSGEKAATNAMNPPEVYQGTISSFNRTDKSRYASDRYFSDDSLLGKEIKPLLISESDFNQLLSSGKKGDELSEALKGKLLTRDQYRKINPNFTAENEHNVNEHDLRKGSEAMYIQVGDYMGDDSVKGHTFNTFRTLLFFDNGQGLTEGRYSGATSGASPRYKPK